MKLIAIVAVGKNNVIGKENKMLWHLPNDFKFFKKQTIGHYVIMGRKTFESLPKLLPNRTHIVITTQKDYKREGAVVVNSLKQAIDYCNKHNQSQAYIIGGGQIYQLAIDIIDEMYITYVDFQTQGDAYFPEFKKDDFTQEIIQTQPVDDNHQYAFEIIRYKRK